MKILNEKHRTPLYVGATVILTSILLGFMLFAAHLKMDTNHKANEENVVCTTTSMTSTDTTSTTSSTTTSTTTKKLTTSTQQTTSTTTTQETTSQMTVVVTEPATEPPAPDPAPEPQPETQPEPQPEPVQESNESIGTAEVICKYSESDAVLLAQLINKEASATWEGKIAVGNCVINRANVNGISIYDVIFARGQFTTCYSLGYYTDTDYQAAVQVLTYGSSDTRIYYFDGCHPDCKNWFYDSYHNYLYAA